MHTYNRKDEFSLALPDGTIMPRLGQGTWMMGEVEEKRQEEIDALKYGLNLLIFTFCIGVKTLTFLRLPIAWKC